MISCVNLVFLYAFKTKHYLVTSVCYFQGRARLLYKAGYKTIQEIAYAEVSDIVQKVDYMTRANAKQLKASATMLIQDKYEALRAEADAVIALPTPVPEISP